MTITRHPAPTTCKNAAKFRDPPAGSGGVAPARATSVRDPSAAASALSLCPLGHEISIPRVAPGAHSKREVGRRLLKRKCQFDGRALANLALDSGRAAVEIDNRFYQSQTQTCSVGAAR